MGNKVWELADNEIERFPHGQVGNVKWLYKTWPEAGLTMHLFEAAILMEDGTVEHHREKSHDQSRILNLLLRAAFEQKLEHFFEPA